MDRLHWVTATLCSIGRHVREDTRLDRLHWVRATLCSIGRHVRDKHATQGEGHFMQHWQTREGWTGYTG